MAVDWIFLADLNSDGDFVDAGEDLSAYVIEAEWFLGFRDMFDYMAVPSWARLLVDNRADVFSPEVSLFPVGSYVLLKSDDGSTVRTMFSGFLESVRIAGDGLAELTLVDFGEELSQHRVGVDGQGVTLDVVIAQALERAPLRQWVVGSGLLLGVTGRDVLDTNTLFGDSVTLAAQTGRSVCAYVGDSFGADATVRDVIAACCLNEQGRFFVARDSSAVFKNRHDGILGVHTAIGTVSDFVGYEYVDDPHRVNLVNASGRPRSVGSAGTVLWELAEPVRVRPGLVRRLVARFQDATNNPVGALSVIPPVPYTDFTANATGVAGATGATPNLHVDLVEIGQAGAKFDLWHDRPWDLYLMTMQVRGTPLYGNRPFVVELADMADLQLRGARRLDVDLSLVSELLEMEDWVRFVLAVRAHRQYFDYLDLDFATNGLGILAYTIGDEVTISDAITGHDAPYLVRAEHWKISKKKAPVLRLYLEPDLSAMFFVLDTDKPNGNKLLAY